MSGETIVNNRWWEQYSSAVADGESHRIELFFRSMAASPGTHDQRVRLVEQVEQLVERGTVDGFDVTVLGREICLCEACRSMGRSQELLGKIEAIENWESERLTAVGFEEREVDSSLTGEQYRLLVPPTAGIQVHVDGTLEGVFPASIDGTHYGPGEFVESLLDRQSSLGRSSRRQEAGPSATTL
jgi:hypothetical protein